VLSGYQDVYLKKLTSSHDADSHKFENNPLLSFDSSHQLVSIILKIKNQNYQQIIDF
jgi:hypothetical protein